jgi:Protein of unknown function (DUF1579)
MTTVRWFCAVALAAVLVATPARAQEPPKPGPEHEVLKILVGDWDLVLKGGGMESKGTATYKLDLGGLWLSSTFEGDIGGQKFQGHGMDSYDAKKKKYVAAWFDSMSATPMFMEGTYDKDKKTLTMSGDGPGPDGTPVKHTGVTEWKDEDTVHFAMYMGDGKEPMFTIVYKRRK